MANLLRISYAAWPRHILDDSRTTPRPRKGGHLTTPISVKESWPRGRPAIVNRLHASEPEPEAARKILDPSHIPYKYPPLELLSSLSLSGGAGGSALKAWTGCRDLTDGVSSRARSSVCLRPRAPARERRAGKAAGVRVAALSFYSYCVVAARKKKKNPGPTPFLSATCQHANKDGDSFHVRCGTERLRAAGCTSFDSRGNHLHTQPARAGPSIFRRHAVRHAEGRAKARAFVREALKGPFNRHHSQGHPAAAARGSCATTTPPIARGRQEPGRDPGAAGPRCAPRAVAAAKRARRKNPAPTPSASISSKPKPN